MNMSKGNWERSPFLSDKQNRINELRIRLPELLADPNHDPREILEMVRELREFLDDPECDLSEELKASYLNSYKEIEASESRHLID